ncbi:hydrogenase iron-sulfur subunit [bacterium]|nr:hydrogenase iron-sulfur subunit [bacterium]
MTKNPSYDHTIIPPCQAECPLHMDIREYVDLIAQGRVMEALQIIREGNPFPSICAYVCTHPCEDACRRGQVDNPIAIRALKKFAVKFGGDKMIRLEAETTHDEKVAIVGSGPAGLAAAYYLRKLGYPVSIFEAHSELGGMLRVGIPEYRLPREVLDIEVQRLIQMGAEIRTNSPVTSLNLLFDMKYKAIFVTVGAHQGLRLGIEGEESAGVVDGATFLREVNLGLKPPVGNRVGIVGGGNVAIDAARTSLRLGSREVKILYRRSREEMPADPNEIEQAIEEGVEILFLMAPIKIQSVNGQLDITCIRMEQEEPDASGRRRPAPVPGSEFHITLDDLITAIGQAPQVPKDFRLRIGRGSTIRVDPLTLTTNQKGIFAGGDAVTGPASVIQALATGKLAASRIDDYLRHRYPAISKEKRASMGDLLPRTIEMIRKFNRYEPPIRPSQERVKEFMPVELVYDWEGAVNEAKRCLHCGIGAEILSRDNCAACLTCLRICPYLAPFLDDRGEIQIAEDQCIACGICVTECPANAIAFRKPQEQRRVDEELEHVIESAAKSKSKPLIIGFCCQYGLYGTGALAGLWRETKAGIWIVPVLCIAKVESRHIVNAFKAGAEGVFIAGCDQQQCPRENTAFWTLQRMERSKKMLAQIGIEPERVQAFNLHASDKNLAEALDRFTQKIGELCLVSAFKKEMKK